MVSFFTGIGAGIVGVLILFLIARRVIKVDFVPGNLYNSTLEVIQPILLRQPLIVIFEEVVFRWGLLNHMRLHPTIGLFGAYFFSSLIFGLAHIPNFGYRFAIAASLAGLVYGGSYILSDFNILVPMIIHALVNVIWQGYFEKKRQRLFIHTKYTIR